MSIFFPSAWWFFQTFEKSANQSGNHFHISFPQEVGVLFQQSLEHTSEPMFAKRRSFFSFVDWLEKNNDFDWNLEECEMLKMLKIS